MQNIKIGMRYASFLNSSRMFSVSVRNHNDLNSLKNMLSQAAQATTEPVKKQFSREIKEHRTKSDWKIKKSDSGFEKGSWRDDKSSKEKYRKSDSYYKKDDNNRGDQKSRNNGKYAKYEKGNQNKYKERSKKESLAFLETGNDRDKDAAKRIISEALKSNKQGLVQLIKSDGAQMTRIVKAYEGLSLNEKGLIIVGTKNIKIEDEQKHGLEVGEKYLILKITERQNVIKQYGEYLSEQVVENLKLNNSVILHKQNKNKKDDNKNELKVVQIGWNISLNDLAGQKKFEIENHLKRGNDVEIIIDDKDVIDKENSSQQIVGGNEVSEDKLENYAKRRKELTDVEITMRNKMLRFIDDTLRSIENLPESNIGEKKGYTESRIIIKVKGIVRKDENEKMNKKELKALEKRQRAERNEQRRAEKQRLASEEVREINA